VEEKLTNQSPEAPETIQKRKTGKVRKVLIISTFSFAVLFLIVIPLLVNFYADRIVGTALREIIRAETNNAYQIEFESVGFNLFKREIDFRELQLFNDTTLIASPDSLVTPDSIAPKIHIDLTIPYFKFKLATIYRAIRYQELIVEQFTARNPQLRICNMKASDTAFDPNLIVRKKFRPDELYGYINNYFTLLKIERFAIEQANLSLLNFKETQNDTLKINNFLLMINNFHLDSLAPHHEDRIFFSDSISLLLHDGIFRYRGPLHEIIFDHLEVSSYDELIALKNVQIVQDSLPNTAGRDTYFSFVIPEIQLNALNVLAILDSNALMVEKIHLLNPELHLTKEPNRQPGSGSADLSQQIFQAATAAFYPLKIDELRITSGNLRFPDTMANFSVPDFDLAVFGIFMDSAGYDEISPLFFADDLVFSNRNQHLKMDAGTWDIFYESLLLDTRSNTLKIENLETGSPAGDQNLQLKVSIPAIEASGEDFKDDFLQHTISLKDLTFSGAKLDVKFKHQPFGPPEDSVSISIYNLYPLIAPMLKRVSAGQLRLDASELTLQIENSRREKIDVQTNLDIVLDGFRLDENASEQPGILYAADHRISLTSLSAGLPFLEQSVFCDEATVNTGISSLRIENFSIDKTTTEKNKSPLPAFLEGTGSLELSGVDFNGLYFGRGVFVDSVKLLQPDFEIFRNYNYRGHEKELSTQKMMPYLFGDVQVSDGRIKICEPAGMPLLDAEVAYLLLEEVSPGSGSNNGQPQIAALETGLRNIYFELPEAAISGSIEMLEASSTKSEVKVKNLAFANAVPEHSSKSVALQVPDLLLQAFPFLTIYHHQVFDAGTILLQQPVLEILSDHDTAVAKGTHKKTFKDFDGEIIKNKLTGIFQSFGFDSLQVIAGSVRTISHNGNPKNDLIINGLDFDIGRFSVNPTTIMRADNLLFAQSIALQADNAIMYLSEDDSLMINNLALSTTKKQITVGDVNIENINNSGNDFTLDGLSLDGLEFYELLKGKYFICDKIRVSQPHISINQHHTSGDSKKPVALDEMNIHSLFSDHLFEAVANDFIVDNARLRIEDTTGSGNKSWYFEDINLRLKRISIDSANKIFDGKIFYADDMEFTINNFSETTTAGFYDFGASLISYKAGKAEFLVENGYLTPNYTEDKFAQLSGVQTDRLAFKFERLQVSKFSLKDFLLNNRLYLDKVEVDGLIGDDFRDKSYPFPQHHYPPLPVSALRKANLPISIDTLLLRNARMTYREYVPPALQPGKIFFTNLNLAGRNITNDTAMIATDSLMRFYISSRLMDEGKMEVQLDFDLTSDKDCFRANGVVNAFDLTSLNPMLEHVAFVRINSGENEMLDFNFTATNEKATGTMRFNYNKLQIRLIDKDNLEEGGSGDGFTSFLANTFVVRRNNPKFLGRPRVGEIYFTRDINKSFFNFLAKSALSGISSTIRGGSEERREKRQLRRLEQQQNQEDGD
jgi:hypothetical protein